MAQMPWEAVWPDMVDSSFREADGHRVPITYSPTVVQFFHDIQEYAEVIWLTTWKSDTKFFPDAFGFPTIPWLDEMPGKYIRNWWKADVMASLPRNRRILWIDDEIPLLPDSEEQILIQSLGGSMQCIVPKTSVGLTPEHLEEILEFVHRT